jgi:hypothetical protein
MDVLQPELSPRPVMAGGLYLATATLDKLAHRAPDQDASVNTHQ